MINNDVSTVFKKNQATFTSSSCGHAKNRYIIPMQYNKSRWKSRKAYKFWEKQVNMQNTSLLGIWVNLVKMNPNGKCHCIREKDEENHKCPSDKPFLEEGQQCSSSVTVTSWNFSVAVAKYYVHDLLSFFTLQSIWTRRALLSVA